MNKTKIVFTDIEIEIESNDETTEQITNRAVNGMIFLMNERVKFHCTINAAPAEDEQGERPGEESAGVMVAPRTVKPELMALYG